MSGVTNVVDIVDELKRIHEGDAWHGPALRELLFGVRAEQAAARALPNAHSIWELVLHIIGWENVFRLRLEGEGTGALGAARGLGDIELTPTGGGTRAAYRYEVEIGLAAGNGACHFAFGST